MKKKATPKSKNKSKFKFTKNKLLGAPDAESDNILEDVYVDQLNVEILKDVNNPKCIVLGRTGSGKSAILIKLENSVDSIKRIAPESMSIKYLSNSDIIQYLTEIGANLHFFYKVLWKHVFIVEIIKLYFGNNIKKRQSWFDKLMKVDASPSRVRAIKYMEKWSDEFWLYEDHRIKILERNLSDNVKNSAKIKSIPLGSEGIIADEKLEERKERIEIRTKAEKVISESQADELFQIIDIFEKNLLNKTQKKHYIIIDDLDKEWVSPQIVYDLLSALIDVIKEFQKFKSVKIVIALRENLNDIIFSGKRHRGGQREKYNSLFLKLFWNEDTLKELINNRLVFISDSDANFNNSFKNNRGDGDFKYILERSFMRPREILSYFNRMIESTNSFSFFENQLVKKAELGYSRDRLIALEDEWGENYGDLATFCKAFTGKHNGFRITNIKEEWFYDYLLDESKSNTLKGDLKAVFDKYRNEKLKFRPVLNKIIHILYKISFLGIKLGPSYKVEFSYYLDSDIKISDINSNCRLYIHKSFYKVLGIVVKEMESDYTG